MMNAAPMLPVVESVPDPSMRWFSERGCVAYSDGVAAVLVGGTLIGSFGPRDAGARNAILVGLVEDPKAHLGRMARAFKLTSEGLRLIRRQYEEEGLAAVVARSRGGSETKVSPPVRRKLEKLFAQGATLPMAHTMVGKRAGISVSTIQRVRADWKKRERGEAAATVESANTTIETLPEAATEKPCDVASDSGADIVESVNSPIEMPQEAATEEPRDVVSDGGTDAVELAVSPRDRGRDQGGAANHAPEEEGGAEQSLGSTAPMSGGWVQHVGTWLMVAMVARLGLHGRADANRGDNVDRDALRIALDALIGALAVGERCVEGVRRLGTATAGLLLRATRAPSATWVRRVIGRFAQGRGSWLHLDMAADYLRNASADEQVPAVFYVDNHMRPYTGQEVVRRGWRMQDKCVVPGASDYYVHDEDGRPVLRLDAPSNGPLTKFLTPIAKLLRLALGAKQRILLAFDRAGAYPEQLAELRDEGFECVTYERRPFPILHASAFDESMELDGERVWIHDARINLGHGRGRVRRIAIRMADGRQVNLLAVSELPAARLIEIMRGRWNQENAFKHGVERWGINQLDGRTTVPYSPETVIPNPARRRLDRALRLARVREGDARRQLAHLPADHARRAHFEGEIVDATRQQTELEALRPTTPTHAPLRDTELAGKLVHHTAEYKLTIDTIRIACANSESDLAGELAPHLNKPAEAKRVLRNLFAAPGRVQVGAKTITIGLQPAGNANEMDALERLLATVNGWRLTLPDDGERRPLRFALHQES